ncbi:30S ribosomal protein S8 [Candidatus Pacearchaeota archaeon]|nr:30S ribosomal protein S8 [uncultured archaeon]MBS3085459.1 30S ribosomal protein S8 [Candidatus Pacearchaeota archaeon]
MSQDILADALNKIRNANRASREKVKISIISNLLVEVLKIMRQKGIVKGYRIDSKEKFIEVTIGKMEECRAIKPRYTVNTSQIERYIIRYLPGKGYGTIILSTNKGLKTHEEALEENIGGCLIAYFY